MGRMISCVKVADALKMRLSSVEISSMTISRQNKPIMPIGKIRRSTDGIIICW